MPPKALIPPYANPYAVVIPPMDAANSSLAYMWESQQVIRNRLLTGAHFTRWVNDDAIGVKSVKAMSLNHVALEVLARFWCPQHPYPTAVKIDMCRKEARGPADKFTCPKQPC